MDAVVKPLKSLGSVDEDQPDCPKKAAEAVRTLLAFMGENPDREGLADTPSRVVRAYDELFGGYKQNPTEELMRTFEEVSGYDEIVIVRDIAFWSHCEHHMVPFFGRAHIAYYPKDRVVGLSKLARVLDIYARRLQTQENLTAQLSTAIDDVLKPRGVAVMLEAQHMCMAMRGVRQPDSSTVTTRFLGCFKSDKEEQSRFLSLVRDK